MLAARVLSNNWSVIGKDNKMADLRDANANDVICSIASFMLPISIAVLIMLL